MLSSEINARARADQQRWVEMVGGANKILIGGVRIPYTPAPGQSRREIWSYLRRRTRPEGDAAHSGGAEISERAHAEFVSPSDR